MERVRRRRSTVATPSIHSKAIGTPATATKLRTPAHSRRGASISAQISQLDASLGYDGSDVVGVSWRIHRATPLCNLSIQDRSLKRMARSLNATIEAEAAKGTGIAIDMPESDTASGAVSVDVTTLPALKGSDDDATAISITITRVYPGGKEAVAGRLILCSVGIGELVEIPELDAPFTYLPVVLLKASAALARTMTRWLEETFDCAVTRLTFTQQDMRWIATEWAAPGPDDKAFAQRPLALVYSVPGDGSLQTITYNIEPDSVRQLQKRLGENAADEDEALLAAIEKHFTAEFSIHLSRMSISRVGTFAVYLGVDGRAKFLPLPPSCDTATLHVLKYITYVATRPPTA